MELEFSPYGTIVSSPGTKTITRTIPCHNIYFVRPRLSIQRFIDYRLYQSSFSEKHVFFSQTPGLLRKYPGVPEKIPRGSRENTPGFPRRNRRGTLSIID